MKQGRALANKMGPALANKMGPALIAFAITNALTTKTERSTRTSHL